MSIKIRCLVALSLCIFGSHSLAFAKGVKPVEDVPLECGYHGDGEGKYCGGACSEPGETCHLVKHLEGPAPKWLCECAVEEDN